MRVDRPAQAARAVKALRRLYPDADCELTFEGPLQLAVAVILSAQCTDKRVNMVTPALFKRYKTAADFAAADPAELEGLIRSTGFFRSKARSIREMAAAVVRDFGGRVPDTMEELLTLRGVARKTANVILNVPTEVRGRRRYTHMKRWPPPGTRGRPRGPVARPICLDRAEWSYVGIGAIWHGRRVCFARKPDCSACTLASFCPKRGVSSKR